MVGRTLAAAACAFALLAVPAGAATIRVKPGKNAIQKAVNRAEIGDRLLIKRGTYRESLQITKRLRIVGRGKRPVIDAGCNSDRAIDILASSVKLSHLKVKGARAGSVGYTVNAVGVDDVRLHDLVLRESCGGAYYGLNVFDTGPMHITGLDASGGFVDAGIYIGQISDVGGTFLIERNEAFGNNVGILIEDSVPSANIVVRKNAVRENSLEPAPSNPAGILVRNGDGGRYVGNRAHSNGDYGIHVDPDSSANVFRRNRAFGNGIAQFFDQGTDNCGSENSFVIIAC